MSYAIIQEVKDTSFYGKEKKPKLTTNSSRAGIIVEV